MGKLGDLGKKAGNMIRDSAEDKIAQAAINKLSGSSGKTEPSQETVSQSTPQQPVYSQEQIAAVQQARNQAMGANPAAIQSTINPSSDLNQASQTQLEAQEKQQQREQEIAEEKEEVKAEVEEKILSIKEERDEKIAQVKEGPSGFLKIFMSTGFFVMLAFIDSSVSSIPGGAIWTDVLIAVIFGIIWAIPALYLFDFGLLLRIWGFLLVDMFVGFGATVIPVVGEFAIDLIPEIVLIIVGAPPGKAVSNAYQAKVPALIARIKEKAELKIRAARDEGKNKLKHFMAGIKGHFGGVAADGQKVIAAVIMILVIYFTFGLPILGIASTKQIIFTTLLMVVLLVLKMANIIGTRELTLSMAVIAYSVFLEYLIKSDGIVSNNLGPGFSAVFIALFAFLGALIILHLGFPNLISTKSITIFMIMAFLLASSGWIIGYVGSDQFSEDSQRQLVESQADLDNLNLFERLTLWYTTMQEKGSGEYIPVADKERVHEFIGVTLDSVEPTRDEFIESRPVQFNIYYSTGSKEEKFVGTSCTTRGISGEIFPEQRISVTNLYAPTVKCTFGSLPKGTDIVYVNSFYDDSSQVQIPLMFMSERKYEEILESNGDPSAFKGGVQAPLTSSGPIDFGVSNAKLGEFKLPLVLNPEPEKINRFPHLINVRLDNPLGDSATQGDLKSVKSVVFNLPEGLNLGNCNFQNETNTFLPITAKVDGRWYADITDHFNTFDPYKTISCNMYIDEDFIDSFLPIESDFSIHTMYYDIDYTYALEYQTPVTVR